MKFVSGSIIGAGALIALVLAYNGTQERLQNDCKTYLGMILKDGGYAVAWERGAIKSTRENLSKILQLSESHKKYCAW